jgi:hypothetical protein
LKHWQLASSQGRFKCQSKSVTIFRANSGRSQLSCSASAGLLKEFALPLSIFASKDVRPFTILTEFMNKRPPAKKPQAKIQTVKKQIPVKTSQNLDAGVLGILLCATIILAVISHRLPHMVAGMVVGGGHNGAIGGVGMMTLFAGIPGLTHARCDVVGGGPTGDHIFE